MPNFSILLPPSEEKQTGGNPFAPDMFDYRSSNTFNYFHELNTERRSLIKRLQSFLDGEGVADIFDCTGPELKAAVEINRNIFKAPLISALDRYSPGVLYQSMDFPGLPTGAQRRLLEHGIILSGLFGLLRPDDLIPNYHLPMSATLPEIGSVASFWRADISRVLNRTLTDRLVWNMLPEDHSAAWDNQVTYDTMVRVSFLRSYEGSLRPVTDGLLPLGGRLVNFIVRETLETLEPLLEWRHPDGYMCDAERSTYDEATRTHHVVMVRH